MQVARLAVVAAALSLLAAGPAAADHVQCGDTIMQDTILDSDLTCSGHGLIIGASGVTLDLGGHTIEGNGTFRGIGRDFSDGAGEVAGFELVDGTVRGFGTGIDLDGTRDSLIRHVVFEGNGTAIECQFTALCRVRDSVVRGNDVGIYMFGTDRDAGPNLIEGNSISGNQTGASLHSGPTLVRRNSISGNAGLGLWIDDDGADVDAHDNVIAHNGGDGVLVTFNADATVADNRIEGNGGDGVEINGSGSFGVRAEVVGNRIGENAGDGVLVGTRVEALIARNRADRNGDDGVDVDPSDCCSDVILRANRAFFNADLGIEAAPGTTDGGGNKARHNGNPAQCVGVSCK